MVSVRIVVHHRGVSAKARGAPAKLPFDRARAGPINAIRKSRQAAHADMKAAPFAYSRPDTLDEACALLAADDGARLIAGGQTLAPLMAMRLPPPPPAGRRAAPPRGRGPAGGPPAKADPAAEIALVAVTLGARLRYRDGANEAEIAAADFFVGPMVTALPLTAVLT